MQEFCRQAGIRQEVEIMFKVLGWMGLYVAAPSVAAWVDSLFFPSADHFVVLFVFSAVALLIALLPRLEEAPRRDDKTFI